MDLLLNASDLWGAALNAAAFAAAIMIIVTVHELGHYWVGRWCGIHAVTFSLGFGPTVFKRQDRHGTTWQLAAIPLGGFVKFLGDGDGASARADDQTMAQLTPVEKRHTLHGAPLWARMLTVVAGPAANVLLTIALIAAVVATQGISVDEPIVASVHALPSSNGQGLKPGDKILAIAGQPIENMRNFYDVGKDVPASDHVTYRIDRAGQQMDVIDGHPAPPVVLDVNFKSAALDSGIQVGDVVTGLDGIPVTSFNELPALVAARNGAPMKVSLWRAGKTLDVTLSARRRDLPDGKGGFETRWLIGLTGGALIDTPLRYPGPLESLSMGAQESWSMVLTNLSGIGHMLTGAISSCNLSSALGMAQAAGQAARAGFGVYIQVLALFSLGIGLANLLPIPVLDGGHLVFHLYEAVLRRPPSRQAMQVLTSLGLALLLGLMLFALKNDLTCT